MECQGFRTADEHECQSAVGESCAQQCYLALDTHDAETYTVFNDDLPVGMFGAVPLSGTGWEPGSAVLWLLGTDGIWEIRHDFLSQCVNWIDHLQRNYPYGINMVHTRNYAAIKWCDAVGFDFEGVAKYGVEEEDFLRAVRRR